MATVNRLSPPGEICLTLRDNSTLTRPASEFFGIAGQRDPTASASRLATQFEARNRSLFALMDVNIDTVFDGRDLLLRLHAGNTVGAVPLFSPTRPKPDYGLVIQPRFEWTGIGPSLAALGWRVAPVPLKLPALRRSERQVPRWVLASMILLRLESLLNVLSRRFEWHSERLNAPRGRVDWGSYARKDIAGAKFLSIPCTFPDLSEDLKLKAAVRLALEEQLRSLRGQVEHGPFVNKLIGFCQALLSRVSDVTPCAPSPVQVLHWRRLPIKSDQFLEGLEAIEWTVEERGLAGLSDLEGLPWKLSMESFFEAWVEAVLAVVARRTGARLRSARKRETVRPISWEPSYAGSQGSLIPDLWLEWEDSTLIVDAKYKRHWQEFGSQNWREAEKEIREQHRADLFQVLAYANLALTSDITACLVYPCSLQQWYSMSERRQLFHKADLVVGTKTVRLWLTAVPIGHTLTEIAHQFERHIRPLLGGIA